MSCYLKLRAGCHHLLVDAGQVREVLDIDPEGAGDGDRTHGCRLWRGAGIRVLDLRRILEAATPLPPRSALVYGEGETGASVMFLCDQILGLTSAEESAFCMLPPSSGRLADMFDRLLPEPSSDRLLLRLSLGWLREQLSGGGYGLPG